MDSYNQSLLSGLSITPRLEVLTIANSNIKNSNIANFDIYYFYEINGRTILKKVGGGT